MTAYSVHKEGKTGGSDEDDGGKEPQHHPSSPSQSPHALLTGACWQACQQVVQLFHSVADVDVRQLIVEVAADVYTAVVLTKLRFQQTTRRPWGCRTKLQQLRGKF